jgi:cobalt-zinc-cadmium efflux system outer membrane protein
MSLLIAALFALQADTVRVPADTALARVLSQAPGVAAAAHRADAAAARAEQARAFGNPHLSVNVDNVGAEEEVTNIAGWRGVEGQAVLTFGLPLGGDRGARIAESDALARGATARARVARADAVLEAVRATAAARRDTRLAAQAREEVATLDRLAIALGAQAAVGRAPEGDAARARLAVSAAREELAARRAEAALSQAQVAQVLGYSPGDAVRVEGGACRVDPAVSPRGEAGATTPPSGSPGAPELLVADARESEGAAGLDLARAGRIPDLAPEVGLRRTMGVEALYAGLSLELPLFGRRSRAVDAAAAEARSAAAEARDLRRAVSAELGAARAALQALGEAGAHFTDAGWGSDLARTVEAVEARWELGEGTLMELLDGRRARLEALSARERWAAAWLVARARLFRLLGVEPTSDLFCDPLSRQSP